MDNPGAGPATGPPPPERTAFAALAVYLKGLRLLLDEATQSRRVLVRQIGALVEEAHTAHRSTIVQATGRIGIEQAASFRQIRTRFGRLTPPPECAACHAAVLHWIDEMVLACQSMVDVGKAGDLTLLRGTQEHLASSRTDARRFNEEYERLMRELRHRVKSAARTRRSRAQRLAAFLRRRPRRPAQGG